MKIVCDDKIPFLHGVLEPYAQVSYLPGNAIRKADLTEADALITRTRTICNRELLEGTNVRFIATATIGFDHIDTQWCQENGIEWTNSPGCNSGSVQQYMASLLAMMAVRMDFRPADKTIGIVGVGHVGKKVEELAKALGFNILLNDPIREAKEGGNSFVSLDRLLAESDIITLHVPLQTNGPYPTFHLLDRNRIEKLGKDQFVINTSRGEVIDTTALKEALKEGLIKGASLDVWENEPEIDAELAGLLFTATPHIAGYSLDGKAIGTQMCVNAVSSEFGLGLDDWIVRDIPAPTQPTLFTVDCAGKEDRQIMAEAITYTYNISCDHHRLLENLSTFEKQRAAYPVRRHFNAFALKLLNVRNNPDIAGRLGALGFTII